MGPHSLLRWQKSRLRFVNVGCSFTISDKVSKVGGVIMLWSRERVDNSLQEDNELISWGKAHCVISALTSSRVVSA
jgi:hypothetical protein